MPPFSIQAGQGAVQLRAGEAAIVNRNGAVLAPGILGGPHHFIQNQFMVVLASSDTNGRAWSSVVYGRPGFVYASGDAEIALGVARARRDGADPLWSNVAANPAVGMLIIEPGSGRSYRIDGVVIRNDDAGLLIAVRHACRGVAGIIARRQLRPMKADGASDGVATGTGIGGSVASLLRAADMVFVASAHAGAAAGASHRLGPSGFVQVAGPHTLRIADNDGDSIFDTSGKVDADARFGLAVADFEGRRLLQLSGRARLLSDQHDPHGLTAGSGRFVKVDVERWTLRHIAERMQWEYLDASPLNPPEIPASSRGSEKTTA